LHLVCLCSHSLSPSLLLPSLSLHSPSCLLLLLFSHSILPLSLFPSEYSSLSLPHSAVSSPIFPILLSSLPPFPFHYSPFPFHSPLTLFPFHSSCLPSSSLHLSLPPSFLPSFPLSPSCSLALLFHFFT